MQGKIVLLSVIILTVGVFFAMALWVVSLRKAVAGRTRELRQSETKYRNLFESSPVMIWSMSLPEYHLDVASPAAKKVTGHSPEKFERDPFFWKKVVVEEDLPKVEKSITEAVEKKHEISFESRCHDPEGKIRHLRTVAVPIMDHDHKIFRIEGITEDVTQQNMLEEQLRRSQRMESIGQLAGGIAHDFNNLLTVILGRSALLLETVGPEHPWNIDLHAIHQASAQAADLTTRLLAFTRQTVRHPITVGLNQLVEDTIKLLHRSLPENVEIDTKLRAEMASVEVDPTQIQQALMNLCINACDAMPEGGNLTIRTDVRVVDSARASESTEARTGTFALLCVADDGKGMDADTLHHVFEPFFSTKPDRGTGLGLTMVYRIIRSHKGWITAYSQPNEGSLFEIYLPLSDKHPMPKMAELPPRGGNECILFVDDQPEICEAGKKFLASYGYQVITSSEGKQALEIYRAQYNRIQLLLLDVVMPVMSGADIFRECKIINPDVKVLLTSGYGSEGGAEELLAEGAAGFVQKPFTAVTLARSVRNILDSKPSSKV
jgi:PAS domain S-box-containing protein